MIQNSRFIIQNINKFQLTIDKLFGLAKLIIVNPPCAYLMVGAGLFYNYGKKQSIYNN